MPHTKEQMTRRCLHVDVDRCTLEKVKEEWEKVPEEYRDAAVLEITCLSDGFETYLEWYSPLTEKEKEVFATNQKKTKEARRKRYEELKKEFGDE